MRSSTRYTQDPEPQEYTKHSLALHAHAELHTLHPKP